MGQLIALSVVLFAVGVGYGALLPLVPTLLAAVMPDASSRAISLHTGITAAVYMLAIVAVAPWWGTLSDRFGRRGTLVFGMAGHALAVGAVAWAKSMLQVYALRVAAGACAGAVLVAAFIAASELKDIDRRASWLAWLGSANLLGFLAGPAMSAGTQMVQGGIAAPLYASAAVSIVALLASFAVPHGVRPAKAVPRLAWSRALSSDLLGVAVLSIAATFALGAFEVGLTVFAVQRLRLGADLLALLFFECSAVMLVVRAWLAIAPTAASRLTSVTVATAFALMAAGFVLLALATSTFASYLAVGLVAAGSGALVPVLTLLASLRSAGGLGAAIGVQTAAAYFGQAAGSAAAGWLYGIADRDSFWVFAALMALAAAFERLALRGALATDVSMSDL